jgi:hypothetical protein
MPDVSFRDARQKYGYGAHVGDEHRWKPHQEGSGVMDINGRGPVTPVQTFYEGPNDIDTISRNASRTKATRFLAG